MLFQLHYSPPPSAHIPFSRRYALLPFPPPQTSPSPSDRVRVACNKRSPNPSPNSRALRAKKKENIWSVDNETSSAEEKGKKKEKSSFRGRRRGRRAKRGSGSFLVSAAMLMEVETVLQTQEPVIKPAWNTFASSVSGIWKGVGAVFSPFTAEMEPLGVGNKNESLYDCYTLSRIERAPSVDLRPSIQRKTNWVTLNPLGEKRQHFKEGRGDNDKDRFDSEKGTSDASNMSLDLPSYESFDYTKSDVLDEDSMFMEPGLVFFEDGSYSRGPVDIPVREFDESKYFLSPTFKFEQVYQKFKDILMVLWNSALNQSAFAPVVSAPITTDAVDIFIALRKCLVKGCHKRLRIVHTIEFGEGGSNLQIIRVAVYEEQWVSPVNLYDGNDDQFDLKPFSQRKRTQPSELAGSWKVFEVSATPIYEEDATVVEEDGRPPYVYLCTETLKKRSLPENPTYFREEEMLDMKDVTVLWLPGGVTGYVEVTKDGILCIGMGWYSEEGINLVMERDYGMDGKLKEVRMKSELKRKWTDQASP